MGLVLAFMAVVGQRGPALAVVGLRWLSWASVGYRGLRWSSGSGLVVAGSGSGKKVISINKIDKQS